ncbi:ATP-binding protein [Kitasatospora acidiphila]|uniref:ATP-binding protein n=1 Tax=Kitasatospora acidiphila TaxID=2567942 RepID=A0A540VX89_9ACTN|nr:ATP-binding protein [Kitasatospora acidiphila]TQF01337.1 ATP-binding protein [Kitasatospora acidiphila]
MSQALLPRSTLQLAERPNAVRLARLHATDVLSRWGVPSDVVGTVELLVSELVTNAVRHSEKSKQLASVPVHTFELTPELVDGAIRLLVWDRDGRPPVLKQVGVEAVSGRGIFIVAAMSTRWGHYPANGGVGKVVWAGGGPHCHQRAADEGGRQSPGGVDGAPVSPNVVGRVLLGMRGLRVGAT